LAPNNNQLQSKSAIKPFRKKRIAFLNTGAVIMNQLSLNAVCIPSEDIVAREIEGDIVIVPLVSGIGDADDELYTLNETGKAIWTLMDGRRNLQQIVDSLSSEYEDDQNKIEGDVLGLVAELVRRKMLVEVDSAPVE
jgi:hypothetical protein